MNWVIAWVKGHADKMLLLIVVLALAFIATKFLSHLLRQILEKSNVPSASIFVNLTRVTIWVFAAALVMQPVFGINPTTVITALGVGGLALSLGLKDTIANVVSGFELMVGKVIKPGDRVSINGTTGLVVDITWRQTVVLEDNGNRMMIPNSVLNTSALEAVATEANSGLTLPFTLKVGADTNQAQRQIQSLASRATAKLRDPATPIQVQFTGFSPYGISGQIQMTAKVGVTEVDLQDALVKALAGSDVIEQRGGLATD
ncbi:transporter [Bifidobacterium aemilianum]|uniref:Transporter n=1 Tax=Bifidobacterium aemilianum TaxID=2493120 RepID=A0A366K9E3_9BIFI|nr:mechanosensitive ion channel domain-containing protein [Bifidobacterium aemilianum]RBP97947.1 transporter [Bifidobacterium aemilianum]